MLHRMFPGIKSTRGLFILKSTEVPRNFNCPTPIKKSDNGNESDCFVKPNILNPERASLINSFS
jgi:hypothetical protein